MSGSSWYVYIVQCSDLSLYTGVTTDLLRRIDEHNQGDKGARYTRARRPVSLVYFEQTDSRATAGKREHALKQHPVEQKRQVIEKSHTQCQQTLSQLYYGNENQALISHLKR